MKIIKKLSSSEAELKKALLIKKRVALRIRKSEYFRIHLFSGAGKKIFFD